MGLHYQNLSRQVRQYMASELDASAPKGARSIHHGDLKVCMDDLREAAESHDDDWLAQRLLDEAATMERERKRRGDKAYWNFVNIAYAAQQTAESEFNKLYVRGVCQLAIRSGIKQVEVYRAKTIAGTSSEPDGALGQVVDPESLLTVLRGEKLAVPSTTLKEADFAETGLSVRLP